MVITEEIRQLAIARASADAIAEAAIRDGMRRLRDDGLEKVRAGRDLVRRARARHRLSLTRTPVHCACPRAGGVSMDPSFVT